jgi:hypothetical protein
MPNINPMKNPTPFSNIGLGQRRLRLIAGLVASAAALLLAAGLVVYDVPRLWRLVLFLPLWVAVGALVEVRAKTCVALALSEQCSLSPRLNVFEALRGDKISDPALAAALRKRGIALSIQIQVIVLALTLLFLLLPI